MMVTSSMDFCLQGAVTESSMSASCLGPDNDSDAKSCTLTPHSEQSQLERHQSYVAQKIIQEASKLTDDKDGKNVEAWHKRAQQVVSIILSLFAVSCYWLP